jgi:hypothetical protein
MVETKQNFIVPKGDDIWLDFDIDPATLEVADLTGAEVIFKISKYLHLGPDDASVVLTKSSVSDPTEFDITNPTAMTYRVKLRKTDMASWDPGLYYHQTQVLDINGDYVTTTEGTAWITTTV